MAWRHRRVYTEPICLPSGACTDERLSATDYSHINRFGSFIASFPSPIVYPQVISQLHPATHKLKAAYYHLTYLHVFVAYHELSDNDLNVCIQHKLC